MIEKSRLQTSLDRIISFLSEPIVYKTEVRTGNAYRIVDVVAHARLRKAMFLRVHQLKQKYYGGQLSLEDYQFLKNNLKMAFRNLVTAKNIP